MKPSRRFPLPFLVFALAVFLLPLVVSGSYVVGVMCFVAIYGALALGKGVLLEQAGIFSLAHPTWFGLGAYVTGIAAVRGLPPLLAILLAAGFVALVAFVIGGALASAQRVLPGLRHLLAHVDHRDRHRQPGIAHRRP